MSAIEAPNGALSAGPRTAEGKAISSKNAIKHGLTARDVVIFGESAEEFEALRSAFVARFEPADEVERFLVERIVTCAWRLRRVVRIEAAIFEQYESLENRGHVLTPQNVGHAMLVDSAGPGAFSQLARHEANIERAMVRTLRELSQLQARRAERQASKPVSVHVEQRV